jgi:hypothetical protein
MESLCCKVPPPRGRQEIGAAARKSHATGERDRASGFLLDVLQCRESLRLGALGLHAPIGLGLKSSRLSSYYAPLIGKLSASACELGSRDIVLFLLCQRATFFRRHGLLVSSAIPACTSASSAFRMAT